MGAMPDRPSKRRPADLNRLASSIVGDATSETSVDPYDGKNPAAVVLGRLGGRKGGRARAAKLTAEQRSEIAKKAAAARWANPDPSGTSSREMSTPDPRNTTG